MERQPWWLMALIGFVVALPFRLVVRSYAQAPTVYHVAVTGCSDSGPGTESQPRCTPQAGISLLTAPGDTLLIHAGSYPGFSVPALNGTAAAHYVIQGEASTVIAGSITLAATGGQFVDLRDFTLRPSAAPAISIGSTSSPYWNDVTVSNVVIDSFGSGGGTCLVCAYGYADRITYDGLRFSNGGARVVVNAFRLAGRGTTIVNSTFRDIGGHLTLGSSNGPIEFAYNRADDILCSFLVDGDGCLQGYNADWMVHHNIFNRVSANSSSVYGVWNMRRTTATSHTTTGNFHHNTVIAHPSGVNFIGLENTTAWVQSFVARDNVFVGYGIASDARSAAIRFRRCPEAWALDHNLFWQNARDISGAPDPGGANGCATVGYGPGDIVGLDPLLDPVTLAPLAGSPVCGAGSDGSDIGAVPCSGGSVPAAPTNLTAAVVFVSLQSFWLE